MQTPRDSKYKQVKKGVGVFQFNPEKIESYEANFDGKKSMRYRYTVVGPNYDNGF